MFPRRAPVSAGAGEPSIMRNRTTLINFPVSCAVISTFFVDRRTCVRGDADRRHLQRTGVFLRPTHGAEECWRAARPCGVHWRAVDRCAVYAAEGGGESGAVRHTLTHGVAAGRPALPSMLVVTALVGTEVVERLGVRLQSRRWPLSAAAGDRPACSAGFISIAISWSWLVFAARYAIYLRYSIPRELPL